MKKIFLVIFITFVSFSSITYAISKFNYESALQVANNYIINSSFDENWKDHSPYIEWKWIEFHTDDEIKISYIEFKVSCDNTSDCGFIMVNYDWDDITIPIASTSWNTPSEVILSKNWWTINNNKLYYFSPFDMYAENINNGDVSSITQEDNFDIILNHDINLTEIEKKLKKQKLKDWLKNKINELKKEAKNYKRTDEFNKKIKDLRDKKQAIPEEQVSYKILPFSEYANATVPWIWWTWYILPSNASNTFVSWSAYSWCNWKLPCYQQILNVNYNWSNCAVWCVPTAYTILFWYYDRKWTFPDLISWVASTTWSSVEDNVMIDLWKNYMSTACDWIEWKTSVWNWMNGWINYAKSKWYTTSTWTLVGSHIFYQAKLEINAWRPVILWNWNHAMVWYWYYNTTDTTKQIIRVNLWYWALYNVINSVWTKYYWTSIDYNINSLYYNSNIQPWINSLVKIIISKP